MKSVLTNFILPKHKHNRLKNTVKAGFTATPSRNQTSLRSIVQASDCQGWADFLKHSDGEVDEEKDGFGGWNRLDFLIGHEGCDMRHSRVLAFFAASGLLAIAGQAIAQSPSIDSGGIVLPEPVPAAPSFGPPPRPTYPLPTGPMGGGLVPGPISPYSNPSVPLEAVTLPSNSPGAFVENPFLPEKHLFMHIGAYALQLGSVAPIPVSTDAAGVPNYTYDGISPRMNWGFIGTLGCLVDNQQFEVTGFYLPEMTSRGGVAASGSLNAPFSGGIPIGLTAGFASGLAYETISQSVTMGNLEGNYRLTGLAHREFELILGVRYFDFQEGTTIFTSGPGAGTDPLQQTNYLTNTYNRMLGPQIGVEYSTRILHGFSFTSEAKTAFMANFMERDMAFNRGDGFNIFTRNRTNTGYAQLFQLGFNLEWNLLERFKIRGGYNLLWLVGVAQSADLVDYNIVDPTVSNKTGSSFFQGPSIEFHFLF